MSRKVTAPYSRTEPKAKDTSISSNEGREALALFKKEAA